MDGALMEVGPYKMKDNHTLEYKDGSWDEFANLLFVDQPVGTGFSYVNTNSYLHELDEMADQFVVFMEKWFELFPQYEHDDVNGPVFFLHLLVFFRTTNKWPIITDLLCRRILRRPVYPVYHQSHP